MRGGSIHGRTSFVILRNASTKINGQWATTCTYTLLLYAYTDIFRWKSKDLLTYNASINSIVQCDLAAILIFNIVTSTFARHSLNARNVINWERNFKENIIKILRRKNKEKGANYENLKIFFCVSLRYEMPFKLQLILA